MADRFDEIAVVESMYDLSTSRDQWLREISRKVASNLGATLGCRRFITGSNVMVPTSTFRSSSTRRRKSRPGFPWP